MKKLFILLMFCAVFSAPSIAQNIAFSFDVVNPGTNAVEIQIFARGTSGSENLTGYTSVIYYDSGETEFVSYDQTPAQALGWSTAGNFTITDAAGSNPGVPSTHDMRLELQQFDGNFTGSSIGGTAVHVGTLVFDNTTAGDPVLGGDAYLSDAVLDVGIQYVNSAFTGHDIFTEGQAQQALPILLSSFDVTAERNADGKLNWTSEKEINSSHFEIERSADGESWNFVEEVLAKGFSDELTDYSYLDEGAIRYANAQGDLLYRLKMIDVDGTFAYSETRAIKFQKKQIEISVFPNPTSEFVNVSVPVSFVGSTMIIRNKLGQEVEKIECGEINTISVKDYISGIYYIEISKGNLIHQEKIIVTQ